MRRKTKSFLEEHFFCARYSSHWNKVAEFHTENKSEPEQASLWNELYIYILANFPKDQHCLTTSVLNPADKQNFASVIRMCDTEVVNLLRNEVDDSQGTIMFLEIIRNVIDALMDP